MTPGYASPGVVVYTCAKHQAGTDSLPSITDLAERLLEPLLSSGWLGWLLGLAVLALVTWVIANPLEASKRFFQVLSFFIGAFSRRFSKAAVEAEVNQFISSKLLPRIVDAPLPRLRVDWVKEAQDARLHADGTVIVRLRRERDQSRNVLMTVWTAIGHINFTHARPYLEQRLVTAVDLEVVRLLANLLGPRAQTIFSTEMLEPRLVADPTLQVLLPVLNDIRRHGLFEQVLLQEFIYLSEQLRSEPARYGLADEAQQFVEWLHRLATRVPGDERRGTLEFIAHNFRVAFILAAKTTTAALGTSPYVRQLGIQLLGGARSIYLLGLTPSQTPLCEEIAADFDSDRRVSRRKTANVIVERGKGPERLRLVHYLRNELYMPEGTFAEQLAAQGIGLENHVYADIHNILDTRVDLRIGPLDARLADSDIAWGYRGTPHRFLQVGQAIRGTVLDIDNERKLIHVGLKQNSPSPWAGGLMPKRGDVLTVLVEEHYGGSYIVRLVGIEVEAPLADSQITLEFFTPELLQNMATEVPTRSLYGRIPLDEWSWYAPDSERFVKPELGSVHEVEVLIANEKSDDLILSRQLREVRDWDAARKKYKNGTRIRATVVQVMQDGLKFELEPGIFGRIPDYKVQRLGHELRDFQSSVMPGSRYDVIVVGIKAKRKEFRLELARDQRA